ncbi:MAG: TIGR03621 family F420-dependent LLM class oxidoreductase [Mycobacterium sp.]
MPQPQRRAFRFGVALRAAASRREWMDKCRKAEDLGYDTIAIIDHLGMPAPFPALMLAAEVTQRARLGTYVLNANFYNPTLLAREAATTDLFVDGRLELGLGTGHTKDEFEAAGLAYPTGAARVDHLERTVSELQRHFSDPTAQPQPSKRPPLLIGGRGDRVLRLAARSADIISFSGAATSRHGEGRFPLLGGSAIMDERVEYARAALGDRISEVDLNIVAPAVAVTTERHAALDALQYLAPSLSIEERAEVPGLLVGTAQQIADKIQHNRERYGFTYVTVLEHSLEAMAPIIGRLR